MRTNLGKCITVQLTLALLFGAQSASAQTLAQLAAANDKAEAAKNSAQNLYDVAVAASTAAQAKLSELNAAVTTATAANAEAATASAGATKQAATFAAAAKTAAIASANAAKAVAAAAGALAAAKKAQDAAKAAEAKAAADDVKASAAFDAAKTASAEKLAAWNSAKSTADAAAAALAKSPKAANLISGNKAALAALTSAKAALEAANKTLASAQTAAAKTSSTLAAAKAATPPAAAKVASAASAYSSAQDSAASAAAESSAAASAAAAAAASAASAKAAATSAAAVLAAAVKAATTQKTLAAKAAAAVGPLLTKLNAAIKAFTLANEKYLAALAKFKMEITDPDKLTFAMQFQQWIPAVSGWNNDQGPTYFYIPKSPMYSEVFCSFGLSYDPETYTREYQEAKLTDHPYFSDRTGYLIAIEPAGNKKTGFSLNEFYTLSCSANDPDGKTLSARAMIKFDEELDGQSTQPGQFDNNAPCGVIAGLPSPYEFLAAARVALLPTKKFSDQNHFENPYRLVLNTKDGEVTAIDQKLSVRKDMIVSPFGDLVLITRNVTHPALGCDLKPVRKQLAFKGSGFFLWLRSLVRQYDGAGITANAVTAGQATYNSNVIAPIAVAVTADGRGAALSVVNGKAKVVKTFTRISAYVEAMFAQTQSTPAEVPYEKIEELLNNLPPDQQISASAGAASIAQ